jgi:hypothetical protein
VLDRSHVHNHRGWGEGGCGGMSNGLDDTVGTGANGLADFLTAEMPCMDRMRVNGGGGVCTWSVVHAIRTNR